MKLEDSIDKSVIIGIPSGEVIFLKNIDMLDFLLKKKLLWIRVVGTNKFVYAFNDSNIKRINFFNS